MSTYLSFTVFLLFIWCLKKLVALSSNFGRSAPYPPGPQPKPLIGNALDFPTTNAHEVYIEWGKRYQSSFVYGSAFGNKTLILNKLEDADELLEQRAKKYSSRPLIPTTELMGWDSWNFALFPYGKTWRFHRQISQQNFRSEAAVGYRPLMLKKAHEMCHRLLLDSTNFEQHNKMLSISMTMMAMYGYEVKSFDDPCIAAATESTTLSAPLLYPGATLVNVIPGLAKMPIPAWFPGAKTWKMATRVRDLGKIAERIPFEFVKESIAQGTAVDSVLSKFFRKKEEFGASDTEEKALRDIATTVYSAASDTTISSTQSFFYLMAVNPQIQRKAQAEIDRVIGHSRLPDFGDRSALPYLEAIYREVLRFAPPLPLGVPHATTEDDYYKGYFIPKGTVVFGNIWAMTRDEDLYDEPFKFNPERFLDESGNIDNNKRILAYGFGRRVCVGKYMASSTMWIIIASVLACFNIEKAKDEFGNEIEITGDYDDLGAALHKSEFRCSFVPRSATIKQLLTV
ncbi:cytochrome P450 [Gymnopilus junonius]|uniref:Cytochrome P450 n=1 Tax=Gymnopilus junonius TaxID=109634 RepID=A0A9P5NGI1_GYMJU|nr:cytochrome P450 [Gymnopilus junonius]